MNTATFDETECEAESVLTMHRHLPENRELGRQEALAIAASWIDEDDEAGEPVDNKETKVCQNTDQVHKPSMYGLCGGFDDVGVSVTRINPKRLSRGYLEPGEPLYVRMPVSDRRIEREMLALRDDDDI